MRLDRRPQSARLRTVASGIGIRCIRDGRIVDDRSDNLLAGAVGAAVLPFVTWPMGLVAGAGYMLYKRLRP